MKGSQLAAVVFAIGCPVWAALEPAQVLILVN